MQVKVQIEGIRQANTLPDYVERTARLAFGSLSERTHFVHVKLSHSRDSLLETCCHVSVGLKTSGHVCVDDVGVDFVVLVRDALHHAATKARSKLRQLDTAVVRV